MKRFAFLFLAACGADTFTATDSGLGERFPDSSSSTDADSGSNPEDSGGLDAHDSGAESSTTDAGVDVDAYVCPTGTAACNDAVTAWCARMKACCNGQCMYAWANAGGQQCAAQVNLASCNGKMVCETPCLSDLQSASCTDIKNSPAPAYVANSCWNLW